MSRTKQVFGTRKRPDEKIKRRVIINIDADENFRGRTKDVVGR